MPSHVADSAYSVSYMCVCVCDVIPSDVRHFDAIAGLDFDAVLEPFPCHFFIRHFTLEHGLFSRLHSQVGYALQNLQLLL